MDEKKAMKPAIVLYPGAGWVGHVLPMTELAKAFVNHGYHVTMVLIQSSDFGDASDVVRRVAASNPSISVRVLSPVPSPGFSSSAAGKTINPLLHMLQLLRRYNRELERFLRSIPRQSLRCLVVDMFCVDAIDVAARVGVPAYTFFASCASALAVLTQVPALLAGRQTGLKELGDAPLEFLGVPLVPASHLIRGLLEHPDDERCRAMADVWTRCTSTRGLLVNTFESLESRAARALRDPRCVPGRVLPPIYCVGPLVRDGAMGQGNAERHECLAWLDVQPECSVVFLSFGSKGSHPVEQLKEIADGLDKSGHRFLWVVRTPPAGSDEPNRPSEQRHEPDLDALLPYGFLQRTMNRGFVVKSWAPQVCVLHHPATGAFVTHCGWNSTLESITAGVPMLCWPLHAEQKMNKVFMTEDMGVAVEMEGYMTGFVSAEEVEAKVRLVMESEEGRELRARAVARRKEARAALDDGGSSQAAFVRFLSDVENLFQGSLPSDEFCKCSSRLC
ncbi:anthocyanidin 5,3-O-glucosyltransferase-like [Phragmites australis]|uniref:anthocyanidin 5,3-O-glucosyltransferase-like n=1 Tax=Phragmites australis TaxID=29695 RepID=UPI002D78F450|nr:anthocyanidin 5,3-O-glucosyltransferase-like [Phragmites australis]